MGERSLLWKENNSEIKSGWGDLPEGRRVITTALTHLGLSLKVDYGFAFSCNMTNKQELKPRAARHNVDDFSWC